MAAKNKYREAHPEWFDEKGRVQPWVLRALIDYDPETGAMTWKERGPEWFIGEVDRVQNWNTAFAGKPIAITGSPASFKIFRRGVSGAQAAFAIDEGRYSHEWRITTKNGDTSDLRRSNIQEGLYNRDMQESILLRGRARQSYFGVQSHKMSNGYTASLTSRGTSMYLGHFLTAMRAALAYDEAAIKMFGPSAITNAVDADEAIAAELEARNERSSSVFRGVCWIKSRQIFHANIQVGGKKVFLGSFKKEADAADAYDKAARKHFGKDAYQNNAKRGTVFTMPADAPPTTDADDF